MNVLIIAAGGDTGGQGIAMKRAFDEYAPGWNVRSVTRSTRYMQYEQDLKYPKHLAEIRELYRAADVVHVRQSSTALLGLDRVDRPSKPVVYHHHGSIFRRNPQPHIKWARKVGAQTLVSTMDLIAYGKAADASFSPIWLPAPIEIEALETLREGYEPGPRLRVGHAPTNRALKQTQEFYVAMRGVDADVELIEGVPLAECLKRKATVDVLYDQLLFGWGNNSLEAAAMGIPCVVGVIEDAARAEMVDFLEEFPFYEATLETLHDRIAELVADAGLRAAEGLRGRAYVRKYHDPRVVVELMQGVYRRAVELAA